MLIFSKESSTMLSKEKMIGQEGESEIDPKGLMSLHTNSTPGMDVVVSQLKSFTRIKSYLSLNMIN